MGLEFTHLDAELADRLAVPDLSKCALLLDIDGTILDLAPAPQEVWVPAELRGTLARLEDLTGGGLAPDRGDALRAAIENICATAPRGLIEILPGKLVFEIKMAGINKAGAVRELMKYPPFKGRNPIFIGDDTTDEPVFPILSQFGGLGFSVGRVVADVDGHFERPESVRAWLARIASKDQGAAL